MIARDLPVTGHDEDPTGSLRAGAGLPADADASVPVVIPLAPVVRTGRRTHAHRVPRVVAELSAPSRAIVHLSAEYHGYARTGGLAEAVAGLAASQARAGHRVYAFVPLYASVRDAAPELVPLTPVHRVTLGGQVEHVRFYRDATRVGGPMVVFVDAPACFDRPGLYGDARGDYPDNHRRFALFARAALEGIETLVAGSRLLHAHDWHAALAPVYARTLPELAASYARTPTVLSVHNAGYQGHFGAEAMQELALAPELWRFDRLEWYGRLNLLKGGLAFCDAAVTVSPAHAAELRTAEGGFGLHDSFRALGDRLVGICNGIEPQHWDPAVDEQLAAHFTANDLRGKAVCKAALQRAFALPVRDDVPLLGMSSRLAGQKGFDLVLRSERLRCDGTQLVIIGEGEPQIREAVAHFAAAHPERVACSLTFTDRLEHQLMAGADFVLMPSLYEPCGLTQMHAQRYGAPVVGRRVGGIADTVVDGDTGFLFDAFDVASLDGALARALALFADRTGWRAMAARAMRRDFGWDHSMDGYAAVYRAAIAERESA